ncbi:allantoinase PuuE [Halomonas huangheensis]|uniref:Chitin deacetylase n=1 Tax=Halomonas huangheensis TaxID=1178482 RepID=W1N7P0_9GAMM|nr:allantoinase PuuE [Halomonas huangheensis]ALM54359.1 allantoinase [Halomonas huangheensis]ERL50920.1 chitin deacetylase [Halomonas huangheensis]
MVQRDLIGYGEQLPEGSWPNGARLAINIVINYEEGSERSFAMGDADQETMTEWGSYVTPPGIRNLAMESMYEYGSRVGIWRILDILRDADVPATFFACAIALEQNPQVAKRAAADGHEFCSHGYRWEEVFRLSEDQEREHIRLAIESITRTTGKRPVGWYCRYGPSVHTRRLLVEEGGFLYDADAYNDDVPYFTEVSGKSHLVVPYTTDLNDFRFWLSPGLTSGHEFLDYLKEGFDVLLEEAERGPRMMSIGLHPRMIGRPGKIRSLKDFIAYAQTHEGVWFATREEIARAWVARGDTSSACGVPALEE